MDMLAVLMKSILYPLIVNVKQEFAINNYIILVLIKNKKGGRVYLEFPIFYLKYIQV